MLRQRQNQLGVAKYLNDKKNRTDRFQPPPHLFNFGKGILPNVNSVLIELQINAQLRCHPRVAIQGSLATVPIIPIAVTFKADFVAMTAVAGDA